MSIRRGVSVKEATGFSYFILAIHDIEWALFDAVLIGGSVSSSCRNGKAYVPTPRGCRLHWLVRRFVRREVLSRP